MCETLTQIYFQFHILLFKPYEIRATEGKNCVKDGLSLWQTARPSWPRWRGFPGKFLGDETVTHSQTFLAGHPPVLHPTPHVPAALL